MRQLSKEGLQSIVDDKQEVNTLSSKDLRQLFRFDETTVSDTHKKLACKRCPLAALKELIAQVGALSPAHGALLDRLCGAQLTGSQLVERTALELADRLAGFEGVAQRREQRDASALAAASAKVDALEAQLASLNATIGAAGFYNKPYDQTQPVLDELQTTQAQLDARILRWIELDELQQRLTASRS